MKPEKIDIMLISVLFGLVALEFFIKSEELSHTQVIIGIIIGFSVGFKLSAVHGSTVSRQAIELARKKDDELGEISGEHMMSKAGYKIELRRKDKLIKALHTNLKDRDEEVKELVLEIEKKGSG